MKKLFTLVLFVFLLGSIAVGKSPIKLPEIVIKGTYRPSFKEVPGVSLDLGVVLRGKEIPRERIYGVGEEFAKSLKRVEVQPKSPGCAYRHSVTSFFATAFKGAEGYYKRGAYLYLSGRFKEALKNFEVVVTRYKKSPYYPLSLYWRGECLFRLGIRDKGLGDFESVCVNFPESQFSDYACYSAGWMMVRKKNYGEALAYLSRAKGYRKSPVVFPSYLLLTYSYIKLGKDREALNTLNEFLSLNPQGSFLVKGLFMKGLEEMKLGLCKGSEETFGKVIRLSSGDIKGYAFLNRGLSRICLGRFDDAIMDLSRALLLEDPHAKEVALLGLVEAYASKGDFKKAKEFLKDLKGDLREKGIRVLSLELYKRGRFKEAFSLMESLKNPSLEDLIFTGHLAFKSGFYRDAIEFYQAALEKGGQRDMLLYDMGVSLYKAGDLSGAEKVLKGVDGEYREMALLWLVKISLDREDLKGALSFLKGLKEDETGLKAQLLVGDFLLKNSRWEDGLKVLKSCLGKDDLCSYMYAQCLFNLGLYGTAGSVLKGLLSSNNVPQDKVCELLLKSLLLQGDLKGVLFYGKRCESLSKEKGMVVYLEAEALYGQGDYDGASKAYRRAIQLGLRYPEKLNAYLNMANAYSNLGRDLDTLSVLLEAEAVVSKERPRALPKVWYSLITYYYNRSEFEYFVRRAEEFLKRYPRGKLSDSIRVMLGDYYLDRGEVEKAERVYAPILKGDNPLKGSVSLNLAWFYLRKGLPERSLSFFSIALSSKEKEIRESALLGAIRANFILKRWKRCLELSQEFEEKYGDSQSVFLVRYLKALSLERLGEKRKAISILEGVVSSPNAPREVVVSALKELVRLSKGRKRAAYIDLLLPLLEGRERAEYHLMKCQALGDATECLKISYLYPYKDVVERALVQAAKIFYEERDLSSLEKVARRAKKVLGTSRSIDPFLEKLKGG